MNNSFQTLEACPNCLIEAVLIETYDYSQNSDKPLSRFCPFCTFKEKNGTVLNRGEQWSSIAQARISLTEWAKSKEESDPDDFCRHNLDGLSLQETAQRLVSKEPISSSFDLLKYLFSGMFHVPPDTVSMHICTSKNTDRTLKTPTETIGELPPAKDIPTAARALASVMLADGQVLDIERRVLDDYLKSSGSPPLKEEDIQSWLPIDLPIPENPDQLINAMIEIAFADEELDETEWRLIREYGRHWSCDLKQLEAERKKRELPRQSKRTRIWRALQTLFFTETP